ncbi:MAG: hypothetical protein RL111_1813 [Pseudomonadota bacterium]|jgi:hypothetical protein
MSSIYAVSKMHAPMKNPILLTLLLLAVNLCAASVLFLAPVHSHVSAQAPFLASAIDFRWGEGTEAAMPVSAQPD